jgi:hypothetical protein
VLTGAFKAWANSWIHTIITSKVISLVSVICIPLVKKIIELVHVKLCVFIQCPSCTCKCVIPLTVLVDCFVVWFCVRNCPTLPWCMKNLFTIYRSMKEDFWLEYSFGSLLFILFYWGVGWANQSTRKLAPRVRFSCSWVHKKRCLWVIWMNLYPVNVYIYDYNHHLSLEGILNFFINKRPNLNHISKRE